MNNLVPKESRLEIKFITHEMNYPLVVNWIKLNKENFKKRYSDRIVNNIYFDSFDYEAFKDNIYGSSSRLKIRYRWYSHFKDQNSGNLEFKFKRNIFGWKKRYKIPYLKIDSKLKLNHLKKVLKQNLSGYDQLIFESNCEPKIINQYKREYYENYNQKFRITIDTSHNIYDQRFKKKVNLTNKTLIQKYIVVEFKFHRNNIDLSKSMLKSLPFRISRNSKYINSIRSVSGI